MAVPQRLSDHRTAEGRRAIPAWPHSRGWGYGPSGGLGLVLIIVIVLVLTGTL
ncbi:DUF3309 domain-containing protein [Halomonas chromatireducens]|uniref:DUF3309 family protein n=1 Tax=Halomonas chromatireducens TaxID=507626 RepID=UPI0011874D6C